MHPRDRAWRPSAAAILLAAALVPAAAADKPCTPGDAAAAEKAIDNVTAWRALERSFRDWGHCDSGKISGLYNEALMRVLIDGWPKVGEGEAIMLQDPPFRDWVARKLRNPDLPKEDTAAVRDLAKSSCPKGHDKMCADLLAATESGRQLSSPDLLQWPSAPAKPAAPADGKK